MDLEMITLSEVKYRKANFTYHLYVESEKVIQMNLLTKQKQTHRHRKQTSDYQREKGVGISQKFGINIFTLLYIKKINDKILLCGTGENI